VAHVAARPAHVEQSLRRSGETREEHSPPTVWPCLDLVVVITASGAAEWSLDPLIEQYVLPAVRR
jgi:hypothetical protein